MRWELVAAADHDGIVLLRCPVCGELRPTHEETVELLPSVTCVDCGNDSESPRA